MWATKGDVVRERSRGSVKLTRLTKVISIFGLAFALVFVPFGAAGAVPLFDQPASDENAETPLETDAETPDLVHEPIQLMPGTPTSTTPSVLKQAGAKLTWNPTGMNETQDSYDVKVAALADEGEPSDPEVLLEGRALGAPEFDVSSLADGAYQWAVRSCGTAPVCNPWSDFTQVTIDGIAPGKPIAEVTSAQYDRAVTLTGSSDARAKIVVRVDDRTCTAVADDNGIWSCQFDKSFGYGVYTASVIASDEVGNSSEPLQLDFAVKELFVAERITVKELPEVLEIAPITQTPENTVSKQPLAVVDIVNKQIEAAEDAKETAVVPAITTDGGIVHSSNTGWQVVGLPWFVWLGGLGSVFAGWRAFGSPVPRGLGSVFSL